MICPKCSTEYREGFKVCSDCEVELVEKPEENNETEEYEIDEDVKFVSILSTFNIGDIAVVKSILNNSDITYFFQGENFNQFRGGVEPAILKVREEDEETVRELLKDFKLKFMAFNK